MTENDELIKRAWSAKEGAFAPYSEYRVGAALLCDSLHIVTGANMEVAGRTAPVHAEMLAFYKAVNLGMTEFKKIAISADGDLTGEAPCGLCQYVMAQFTEELTILVDCGDEQPYAEYQLTELIGEAYRPNPDTFTEYVEE